LVTDTGEKIDKDLQRETYKTKTRGERLRPARPAGEGVHALVPEGSRLYLVWALELPEKPGPVQKAFNIPQEAALAISIANPEKRGPHRPAERRPGGPLSQIAAKGVPRAPVRDRRPAPARQGAQVIFIGAREDPEKAYQIDLQPESRIVA
jgi:hypothetical protein